VKEVEAASNERAGTVIDVQPCGAQPKGSEVTVTVSTAASTRLDMSARGLGAVVRASPHYFVSPEDIQRASDAVAEVARRA